VRADGLTRRSFAVRSLILSSLVIVWPMSRELEISEQSIYVRRRQGRIDRLDARGVRGHLLHVVETSPPVAEPCRCLPRSSGSSGSGEAWSAFTGAMMARARHAIASSVSRSAMRLISAVCSAPRRCSAPASAP